MIKRIFDFLAASVGLIFALVPMLAAAILTKATSKGPVLFKQARIGRQGRPFILYKFRTMAEGDGGPSITAAGDSRITSVGAVLRRWKIDELPQLFNVLVGDMGIIGPRPELEKFVRLYTPEQRRVLEQRPGLASMAQLVYPNESEMLETHPDPERAYSEQLVPRKVAADLEYERRRTLLTDLRLIGEIALLVLGRRARVDTGFRLQPPAPRS